VRIAGFELRNARSIAGGDICSAYRGALDDGTIVFAKTRSGLPPDFFTVEADGLDLLRVAGGPPIPSVIAASDDGLVLGWVEQGRPTVDAARQFGRALARMHAAALSSFGAARDGYVGSLPLPNTTYDDWPTFYVENRLVPYLDALSSSQRRPIEAVCSRIDELAGPPEPAARIHGDLWSGNLLWGADEQVWLIDAAAAHGGHRETDLAMLQWFGAPHLEVILAAYDQEFPLAPGWRDRVALHQLHSMLVHATLFGGGYGDRAAAAAASLRL